MKKHLKVLYFVFRSIFLWPHLLVFLMHGKNKIICRDIDSWSKVYLQQSKQSYAYKFLYLMTFLTEFRNLFYKRIGIVSRFLRLFCKQKESLYIYTEDIGQGLFIQHGFSTVIAAKSIGDNVWINQQVTIGFTDETNHPVIGDNVTIGAGVIIVGDVKIGNNSKIGAGTTIVKDVPENCTVVGGHAFIVKRDGKKVREEL